MDRLEDELGLVSPGEGLSRVQIQVLAALARSPLGLVSVRAVARRAGVSPTAAGRALDVLAQRDLVVVRHEVLALGKAVDVTSYHANVAGPMWREVADVVSRVRLPARTAGPSVKRVPPHLRHLFWNTAMSQLDIAGSSDYIARRLLATGDLDGLAWGARHLPADAWQRALGARGIDDRTRALAANISRSASDAA